MKKVLFIIILLISVVSNAQIQGYNDLGVLVTTQSKQTTARTMAMKNAFGALGGDLSAISINPAGTAVFNNSVASMTLGYSNLDVTSDFYGTKVQNNQENLNFSQLGGVLVFDTYNSNQGINKVNFAINYNLTNDFKNTWMAQGAGDFNPNWAQNPFNNNDENYYTDVAIQKYTNISSGSQSEVNFAMAVDVDDEWFWGASLNAHTFDLKEEGIRQELTYTSDLSSNDYVDVYENFWQEVNADGFSVSLGFIYKPTHSVRLGLSYNSPVWYDVHEDHNIHTEDGYENTGFYDVIYSADGTSSYSNNFHDIYSYDYQLRTPSKWTGSAAFVMDKQGLFSIDIIRQNYKNIKNFPKYDFTDENLSYDASLRNTTTVNLGTEWRFDKLSLRGGYSYAQTPYQNALDSDNLEGYSLGFGFNFGEYALDFAYDHSEQTGYYDYYPEFNNIISDGADIYGAELTKSKDVFLATLSYKF